LAQAFSLARISSFHHPGSMAKAPAVKWTREHFLIALNLYEKILFGKLHRENPLIIQAAERMGRTPNSLAMKLCNFASLDPVITASGRKGLSGATPQDRAMWQEFHANRNQLGPESEQLVHDLFTKDENAEVDFLEGARIKIESFPKPSFPEGPTERIATVRLRRSQQFFRQTILASYGVRCCISGINVPRLLVASHIKPWAKFPESRLDPRNGLCLSSIHDAAFDEGLITLDENLCVLLSKKLKQFFPQPALEQNFTPYEGKPIRLPQKLATPASEFLSHHREAVFKT
jgi:putative restriction endonuclease